MADEMDERRAQRSPNYPLQPLDWAVQSGLKLLELEGVHAVSPDIIAGHLGYKDATNGRAKRVLANLKAFGIIQKAANGKLAVSQELRRFKLHPNDADRAILIRQWLKKPLLYAKLFEKYGDSLPSDRALVFELVDEHGFMESSAQGAIDVFRASIRYAEQITKSPAGEQARENDALIDDGSDDAEETSDSRIPPAQGNQPPIGRIQPPIPPPNSVPPIRDGVRYPIRLAGGRMAWIDVPDPFYEADKNRIKAQLEIIGTVDEDEAFRGNEM